MIAKRDPARHGNSLLSATSRPLVSAPLHADRAADRHPAPSAVDIPSTVGAASALVASAVWRHLLRLSRSRRRDAIASTVCPSAWPSRAGLPLTTQPPRRLAGRIDPSLGTIECVSPRPALRHARRCQLPLLADRPLAFPGEVFLGRWCIGPRIRRAPHQRFGLRDPPGIVPQARLPSLPDGQHRHQPPHTLVG